MRIPVPTTSRAAIACTENLVVAPSPRRSSQIPSEITSAAPRSSPQRRRVASKVSSEAALAASPTAKPAATERPPSSGMPGRRLTERSVGSSTAPSARASLDTHGVARAATAMAASNGSRGRLGATSGVRSAPARPSALAGALEVPPPDLGRRALEAAVAGQDLGEARFGAQAERQVDLGLAQVAIDEEHAPPEREGSHRGEVDRSRGLAVPGVGARDDDCAHLLLARHRIDATAQGAELLRHEGLRLQQRDPALVPLGRRVGGLPRAPPGEPAPPQRAPPARLREPLEGLRPRSGRDHRRRERELGRALAGRATLALLFRTPQRIVDLGHATSTPGLAPPPNPPQPSPAAPRRRPP